MRFIQRFEKIAEYEEVNERDKLHYFGETLKENATTWYELN